MADNPQLTQLIEPMVEAAGLALVRVKMIGGTSDPTLQIMAERSDTRQLTLDDCSRLSRRLSEMLDALEAEGKDPIPGSYRLEVSSPGIDRPLTRLTDYTDWSGHEARISLAEKLNGRKQFTGNLIGSDGEDVLVDVPGLGETRLPFAAVQSAKLVMTDRLIAATAPLSAEGADEVYEEAGSDPQQETKAEED
ncbi:MAG TPA: ribosome maturation protein RimP [Allosphingosinicella sp.]|jgi:ribosome maturation factor RimP|uniref:ribosome maturation protein RimP n=1 Tax=Allosphingosinicella sp. TaxID=2823234 RepID=UPI002F2741DB